jgi:chaperone modulatory protein CbpM
MSDPNKLVITCIQTYIEHEWIIPAGSSSNSLDAEDLARIRLIEELQESFGVNDESIPIILHLIDQLHCLRNLIKKKPELPLEKPGYSE